MFHSKLSVIIIMMVYTYCTIAIFYFFGGPFFFPFVKSFQTPPGDKKYRNNGSVLFTDFARTKEWYYHFALRVLRYGQCVSFVKHMFGRSSTKKMLISGVRIKDE